MLQDLEDGGLFVKAVFELCRDSKDGFPPVVGMIREKYFDLKKRSLPQTLSLPDSRWTAPPPEWEELKNKLGLKMK
jgi:hypothetical protein